MKFLNKLKDKLASRFLSDSDQYRALISTAATAGDLDDKDGAKLEALANRLGVTPEEIETDVATMAEAIRLQASADQWEAARTNRKDAKRALAEAIAKRDTAMAELNREVREAEHAADHHESTMTIASSAARQLGNLQSKHPRLWDRKIAAKMIEPSIPKDLDPYNPDNAIARREAALARVAANIDSDPDGVA